MRNGVEYIEAWLLAVMQGCWWLEREGWDVKLLMSESSEFAYCCTYAMQCQFRKNWMVKETITAIRMAWQLLAACNAKVG